MIYVQLYCGSHLLNLNETHVLNKTLNKNIKSTIFDMTNNAELSINVNKSEEMQFEKMQKKAAKYLGQRMAVVSDILELKPQKRILILKIGSCLPLQAAMKSESKPITVINTYSFDSLCQSFLIGYYDKPIIQEFIQEKALHVPLFKMIINILETDFI
ncbi:hypothetical protein PUN28_002126 [Cardiocondyla obscurior]|uniref:Uncharacterized protein n=1 Tax=Cardiocondyla obscurior TaxID=286306 RepID=A0AAW2GSL9_9HYME